MALTAAASGFFVFLLSVQVTQGQYSWGVTYTSTEICAVKGSTVEIRCSYTYPSRINGRSTKVEKKIWFTNMNENEPVDLKKDSSYTDRVEYRFYYTKSCTLSIKDVRESDSAVYKFRFTTNPLNAYTGEPGVTLSVTDPDLQVQVSGSYSSWLQLTCHSRCVLPRNTYYVWYKNGQRIWEGTSSSYSPPSYPANTYYCAIRGFEAYPSPSVYAPKLPSVSASPSRDVKEGSSVTLTCSSDANPAAKYTWYQENGNRRSLSEKPQLNFSSIQSSDSGEYYCTANNGLGRRLSNNIIINVMYAPKPPSVSVSPSGEIIEGSSVTLTCSSDANPAANYTWYKKNLTMYHGENGIYHFLSSSEDRGTYYCRSENQHGQINSSSLFVDVQYAPKLPSVSVSPSAEIVEGSSVNLTCSSDANPAATYTWYMENEDSLRASGQIFTITDIRAEHSGNYYCEAQNTRGRHNSTLHPIVVSRSMKSVAAGSITAIFLVVIFLLAFLFLRRQKSLKKISQPKKRPDDKAQVNTGAVYDVPPAPRQRPASEQQDDFCYANVSFSKNQEDPLYTNVRLNQPSRHKEEEENEDDVEYTVVNFKSASAATESIQEETEEDASVLYSSVVKKPRV